MIVPAGLLGLALLAAAAEPPAPPTAQDRFEALVREVGALRSDLEKLDRQERTLLNEKDRLELESTLHARELVRLGMAEEKARRDLEKVRIELEAGKASVAREEADLSRQLRTAYEMGRSSELRLVLSLTEPVDVMRAIAYIDVMAGRQAGRVAALRQAREEMEALERAHRLQAASLDELAGQETARVADLDAVRRRSAELLEATRMQGDAHRRAIGELTRAATELEAAIVQNSGGQAQPALDIDRMRGAVEWPVPGEIDVPFGAIRNPKFGTVTPHPGIDIRTEPREPIRAVLPGRVMFSRRFSGYGNTVLVDHGGNYLSVYARAAVVSVVEGQEVLPGQVLGFSAEQAFDNGPPTVYFEFRCEGRAVDPALWLKRKAAIRREEDR